MSVTSEPAYRNGSSGLDRPFGGRPRPGLSSRQPALGCSSRFAARLHRDLDSLATTWTRLEAVGHATVFQRFDWLQSIARHLAGPDRQLLVVEVMDTSTSDPVLLVPLTRRRRLGVWVASWANFDVCDYAAPVMAPGTVLSPDEAAAAWAAVLSVLPPVDLVDIAQIPSRVGGVPNPLALLPGCGETRLQAFGLELEGEPKSQMERLIGRKKSRRLQALRAGLAEHGAVRLVEPSTAQEIDDLFATLVDQRRRRFREIGRHEILNVPSIEAFYRDMALRSCAEGGPVKVFGLMVGDEVVAATYMLVHGGAMHGILLSIGAARWNEHYPGLIVAMTMIEWAAARGLSYFDMTIGSLAYKSRLGGKPQNLFRLLEPRTGVGRLAAAGLRLRDAGEAWLEAHSGLRERLRAARQWVRRTVDGRHGRAR